jgi:hypothetical protein
VIATAVLLAALHGPSRDAPPAANPLVWQGLLFQNALLFTSDAVTAGGLGGGLGVQLQYDHNYLVQADISLLSSLGNTVATRLSWGIQRDAVWAPAVWATLGTVWGERMEFLTGDGRRPPIPTWALGLRGSVLRFSHRFGTIQLLELGAGTNFGSGVWFGLTVLEAGMRF